jgi:iron complex outermembrane receptor protein
MTRPSVALVLPLVFAATAAADPTPSPAPPPTRTEYVEVTATRVPEPADEVPASVTVIGDREMRDRGAADLRDALVFAQGVDISPGGDQGPAASVPEFWGLREFDAFLLVVDGVPWGGAFNPALGTLDLHDVERVEVLRGAAPVMYGATSFVGVIQVVRKAPADTPREAAASLGRFGSGSARVASTLGTWAGFSSAISLDAERRGYSGERARFDRGHLVWRNARPVGSGLFRLDADGTWLDQDPPSPHPREGRVLSEAVPLDANHNPAGARLDERRLFLSTGYDRPLRATTWSTALSLTRSTQDVLRRFLVEPAARAGNARGIRGEVDVTDLYFDTYVAWTSRRPVKVVAGVDHLHGEGRAEGGTFDYTTRLDGRDPAAAPGSVSDVGIEDRREFSGAYGFVEWTPSPAWRFETGARLNRTAEEREGEEEERDGGAAGEGEEREEVRVSGLAGVTWTPWRRGADALHVYADARETFKPAAAELNLGEEEAGEGGILEPETARSYELGVKARAAGGRLAVEVGSFWMDFRNLVVAQSVNGLPALTNAGSERFKGIETGISWDADHALSLRGTYALHDARFRDFVMDFDGVPTQLAGKRFEMSAHHLAAIGAALAPAHGLVAHAEARYNGSRFLNKRNTALAEGFATVDAGLGWRAARVEVRAEGRNLTDRRDPIAESEIGDAQYYRMPARRLDLTARVHF